MRTEIFALVLLFVWHVCWLFTGRITFMGGHFSILTDRYYWTAVYVPLAALVVYLKFRLRMKPWSRGTTILVLLTLLLSWIHHSICYAVWSSG